LIDEKPQRVRQDIQSEIDLFGLFTSSFCLFQRAFSGYFTGSTTKGREVANKFLCEWQQSLCINRIFYHSLVLKTTTYLEIIKHRGAKKTNVAATALCD
jgi:hypothetical protein